MPPTRDLTGTRFGHLTVLRRHGQDRWRAWHWSCQCDCGRQVVVRGSTLAAGRTSACASCATTAANTTHGKTDTALYRRWRAMLVRAEDPSNRAYHNYGGRGIKVCAEWHDFVVFARDMGPTFDEALELDRIDTEGHYEPGNCRWVDRRTQQRNRRNNHVLTWHGRSLTVQEWGEVLDLKPNTIITRLRRGWDLDRALTEGADPNVLHEIANDRAGRS